MSLDVLDIAVRHAKLRSNATSLNFRSASCTVCRDREFPILLNVPHLSHDLLGGALHYRILLLIVHCSTYCDQEETFAASENRRRMGSLGNETL
jgi:hypothetical protein